MNKSLRIMALLVGLLPSRTALPAEVPAPDEYQVKAAILYNLTKYVDWPAQSFPTTNSPLVLGILGEDNFGDDFKRMIEGKVINGRMLVLKNMDANGDLKSTHLLFISASEKKRLPEILDKLKNTDVLTVGECDSFIQLGGIINLPKKDGRISPQVSLPAAERAHLKISSKLLSVSEVIKGKPGDKKD